MRIGICSFAFHRTVAQGKLGFDWFARTSKELGCTQLDPWNAHLLEPEAGADGVRAGKNPHDSRLGTPGDAHVELVARQGAAVGLPFGCIAVDGAHIIEKDDAAAKLNRERALRWIDVAAKLKAESVRIDAGGPEEMDAATLARIAEGYREIIDYAGARKVRVLIENHWGPSQIPANVERILDACPGLGLLFDTNNWKAGLQREGWDRCARRAEVVHVKTFVLDDQGEETTVDLKPCFQRLREAKFRGTWCVESVPKDGDEVGMAKKTIALIRRRGALEAVA
jgi:sugar phosphate isomerase/epimerase